MLVPLAPGAPKEALQLHLRLLAEAHKRVRTLVDQLQARRPARAAARPPPGGRTRTASALPGLTCQPRSLRAMRPGGLCVRPKHPMPDGRGGGRACSCTAAAGRDGASKFKSLP